MARMKIEVTAQFKARRGFTLRDRVIANLPRYAAAASRVAGLMNLRDRVPGAARLGERVLGLSARRSLPRWRHDTFRRRAPASGLFASADELLAAARRGEKVAVLFVDTFTGAFEPENAWAAARVLAAAGYLLHAPEAREGPTCCGRTWLASGMVDEARRHAGALVAALRPFAQAGVALVGLEPSCLLTLRDEALVLGLGEAAAQVAQHARLFEEFVAEEARAGRLALALRPASAPLLVHGHCHQKAFGAVGSVLEVLRLIPGAEPELIESSCCGMAGAFGYEAANYEVSLAMAEASLLPAVRRRPEAIVVADGTSCRHQIRDGAAREAVHVARLLEQLLG